MSPAARIREELRTVGLYTVFFAAWFGTLMLMKDLVLAEYDIEISGVSAALIGALVLAKVVLVLEHVPLGAWTERRPAWVDVAARTALYGLGVLAVLLLEKAFEARHERGGFVGALATILQHPDMPHVLVNAITAIGALLVFNAMAVVRRHLGEPGLRRIFMAPLPPGPGGSGAD